MALKASLKKLVASRCSPAVQRVLRRSYLSWAVVHDRGPREAEMAILASLVATGDAVADIGANVGIYTKALSRLVGAGGTVYAFEPVVANYEILCRVVDKAGLGNVRPFQLALAARAGRRGFTIPRSSGFTGYYQAHFAQSGVSKPSETVTVATLDGLWPTAGLRPLDFIKCDVEGAELEVIEGGLELVKRDHPGWLVEVSGPTSVPLFRVLASDLGYVPFVYDGHLRRTEGYLAKEFLNYFFLHPESRVWSRARAVMSGDATV